jgi:hypothetical protein
MSETKSSSSLPVPIKDSPHWRVVIRPDRSEAERIPTLKECWRLIESSRVSLRGWPYPLVDERNRILGNDWVASWCDFMGHREYWRFYQSSQFAHLFSFWEDSHGDKPAEAFKFNVINLPQDFTPSGYTEVISTLYIITEIFEFTARLAQQGVLGDLVSLSIEMVDIKDRVLFLWDWSATLYGIYQAKQKDLGNEWRIETKRLLSDSSELAIKATNWFFERFGWLEQPIEVFRAEQKKLLERQL